MREGGLTLGPPGDQPARHDDSRALVTHLVAIGAHRLRGEVRPLKPIGIRKNALRLERRALGTPRLFDIRPLLLSMIGCRTMALRAIARRRPPGATPKGPTSGTP